MPFGRFDERVVAQLTASPCVELAIVRGMGHYMEVAEFVPACVAVLANTQHEFAASSAAAFLRLSSWPATGTAETSAASLRDSERPDSGES